ncbi:hypothetical protein BDF14DRAFT_1761355 [Spinellus fusiger]|nr:hypothetical protein BDF14DRAFT_1761355 [Spinellus fusiger]
MTGVLWCPTHTNTSTYILRGSFLIGNTFTGALMYDTTAWKGLGILQGQVYALALLENYLFIGRQFHGQGFTSFMIYDLVNDVFLGKIRVSGVIETLYIHPNGQSLILGGDVVQVRSVGCISVCVLSLST